MNQLEQIEKQFNFKYPELYRQLYEEGMLDWGEMGQNWHLTYWGKFKSNPPLLLFGDDIELLACNKLVEEVKGYIEAFKDPEDYRKTKSEFHLCHLR